MSWDMDDAISCGLCIVLVALVVGLICFGAVQQQKAADLTKADKERVDKGAAYLAEHGIKPVGTQLPEAPAPVATPAPAPTVTTITVGIQPMTLRQWYAGQALAGMAARTHVDESCVQAAFAIADAMIAEGGE